MNFPLQDFIATSTAHPWTYVLFGLIGFAFGFTLEMSGFGNSRKLAAQFYFTDLTVLKVMFTAIVTAMVLTFGAAGLGSSTSTRSGSIPLICRREFSADSSWVLDSSLAGSAPPHHWQPRPPAKWMACSLSSVASSAHSSSAKPKNILTTGTPTQAIMVA